MGNRLPTPVGTGFPNHLRPGRGQHNLPSTIAFTISRKCFTQQEIIHIESLAQDLAHPLLLAQANTASKEFSPCISCSHPLPLDSSQSLPFPCATTLPNALTSRSRLLHSSSSMRLFARSSRTGSVHNGDAPYFFASRHGSHPCNPQPPFLKRHPTPDARLAHRSSQSPLVAAPSRHLGIVAPGSLTDAYSERSGPAAAFIASIRRAAFRRYRRTDHGSASFRRSCPCAGSDCLLCHAAVALRRAARHMGAIPARTSGSRVHLHRRRLRQGPDDSYGRSATLSRNSRCGTRCRS